VHGEHVSEVLSRSEELTLHRAFGTAPTGRDIRDTPSLEVEGVDQLAVTGMDDLHRILDDVRNVVTARQGWTQSARVDLHLGIIGRDLPPPGPLEVVPAAIPRDLEQPLPCPVWLAQTGQVLPGLDHGFLDQILHVGEIAQLITDEAGDGAQMGAYQFLEGPAIARIAAS